LICFRKLGKNIVEWRKRGVLFRDRWRWNENGLFVELDIFEGDLAPLVLAEIEFPDEAFAKAYQAPSWLKEDVTYSSEYHNSTLSKKD